MQSTIGAHFGPVGGKLRFVETPTPIDQSKFKIPANVSDVLFAQETIDAEPKTFAILWKSLGTLRIRTAVSVWLLCVSRKGCLFCFRRAEALARLIRPLYQEGQYPVVTELCWRYHSVKSPLKLETRRACQFHPRLSRQKFLLPSSRHMRPVANGHALLPD